MKKTIIVSVLLVGIGIFMGILLISSLNSDVLSPLFANEKTKIGASVAPVQMDNAMKIINDAMSSASAAVLPTIVYINVETEIKGRGSMPRDEFHDFFRFFGGPEGEDGPNLTRGSGSGVIVSENGYIVTNNHVVENATDKGIKVQTIDKKEYTASLIGRDPYTDLALLKIEAEGLPVAHIGDMDKIRIGEMVLAVGNPMGLEHTVTSGIVSAIGRGRISGRGGASIEHYIQTDAAINPGNSGGGLFDLNGSLVGINTAIATRTGTFMGYGFAIPVDLMTAVIDDLIEDGKIDRGYIGVFIKDVDETMAKGLGLDKVRGVLVDGLVEDGAAKAAGIESGDVILDVDGKEVNSPSELQSRIVFYKAGDKINVRLWRDRKTITKTVTLKAREEDDLAASTPNKKENEPKPEDNAPVKFESLGFTIAPIDSKIKKDYGVDYGVIVSDVKRFSMAADRGLANRAVITEADKKSIKSPGDLKKIIDSKSEGDVIILNVKYPERSQIVALEVRKS
ncbi:MAG: Do family serine endopeptidase [Candidatus Kapabacteria bacterium]|nr:Do family serine endopeptidase [Ignavibacteriota bacterium]MCW5883940.1 Do family serine endopeptidase [Candidatus Kapabacteria bacterium]